MKFCLISLICSPVTPSTSRWEFLSVISWDIYMFFWIPRNMLKAYYVSGTGAKLINKTYPCFHRVCKMSSNLHGSPTISYYPHFIEKAIEAAMDTGPLYPSLSSKLPFIQQNSFCLELFSTYVCVVWSVLCESPFHPLSVMEIQYSKPLRQDDKISPKVCSPEWPI